MRFAFVLRLGNDTQPSENFFEGWVEEVDSCIELRFHSTEELLKFLGQRFDQALASVKKETAGNKGEPVSSRKRSSPARKSKQS